MGGAKKSAKFHQVLPVALGQANLYLGRFTATADSPVSEQESNPVCRIGSQLIECVVTQLAFCRVSSPTAQSNIAAMQQMTDR
jgi:hypothetical protein